MADHSKPALAGTSYPDFRDQLMARIDDALRSLDPAVTSPTNIPTGSVRWSSAAKKWQIWSGTAWGDLESEYAINIGGYAAKLKTKRNFQISGGATAAAVEFDGSGNVNLSVTEVDGTKVTAATATNKGAVELATNAETQTGTDGERAITPAGLSSRTATDTRTGVVELATDAETQTGSDNARAVTPAGLSSRTATETRTGLVELATEAETVAGTDADRAVTPKGLAAAMISADDLQWLGTPIGKEFSLHPNAPLPPTSDPRFRYVILTAGLDGTGQYNEGVLTSETVTGSDPTITATAVVSLAGSPMNGQTIDLINTSRVFLRPGTAAGPIVASQNKSHNHNVQHEVPAYQGGRNSTEPSGWLGESLIWRPSSVSTEGGAEAHPRYTPRVYLMRIL